MLGVTVCKFAVLASLATVNVLADAAPKTLAVGTGYLSYAGYDYIPLDGTDEVAVDLEGAAALSAEACAQACEVTPGCNGASFYPDPESYFGNADMKNCWMKTFSNTCDMPADSWMEPLAVLILKPDASCDGIGFAHAPGSAPNFQAETFFAGAPQAADAPAEAVSVVERVDNGQDNNDRSGPNTGAIAGGAGGSAAVLIGALAAWRARAAAKRKQADNSSEAPDHQKYPEGPDKESYPSKHDEYKYPSKDYSYPSKDDFMPSKYGENMPEKY